MVKLQEFGQKLGSNKFLSALQGSMMSCMAPIMVGAIFSIICAVGPMFGIFQNGDAVYNVLYMPYHFTMDLLSLWIVLIMAYNYGKALGLKSPIMTSVQTAVCFALIACTWGTNEAGASVIDVTYFSSQGMFVSFFVCWFVCQVEKFCQDHNVRIKMPDVCPPSLVNGFSAILPLAFALIPLYALEVIISTSNGNLFRIHGNLVSSIKRIDICSRNVRIVWICSLIMVLWNPRKHGIGVSYPTNEHTGSNSQCSSVCSRWI